MKDWVQNNDFVAIRGSRLCSPSVRSLCCSKTPSCDEDNAFVTLPSSFETLKVLSAH